MSASFRKASPWLGAGVTAAVLVILLVNLPVAEVPTAEDAGQAALRVQLDPETGDIVPVTGLSADELNRQMAKRLTRTTAGLAEVRHADGSVSIDLEGRFQSLSVATIDSTGQVWAGCVTSRRELAEFSHRAAAAQDKE